MAKAAPLAGIRVVELGEMVAAAHAGKWFADLGAEVIKIEAPEGDRARRRGPFAENAGGGAAPLHERGALFLYLNAGKKSAVLNLDEAQGRAALHALLSQSQVLLHNLPPVRAAELGLEAAALRARHPALVAVSITPFGASGCYRNYRAENLTVVNAGGWGWLSPGALRDPERPPLQSFGHQGDFQGALAAAATALAALYRQRKSGGGEAVDLSVREAVAAVIEVGLIGYSYGEQIGSRHGVRGLQPWGIFECQGGRIFLATMEQDQWERLVEFMGRPEWATMEIFESNAGRVENYDVLHNFLQEWIAPQQRDALFHEAQKRRICFAPVYGMQDIANNEHLRAREFFTETNHGPGVGKLRAPAAPGAFAKGRFAPRGPAPRLGQHTKEVRNLAAQPTVQSQANHNTKTPAPRPLKGIKVADFSWVWAGPFAAMQLAHLGADVIKFESAQRLDIGRRLPVLRKDLPPGVNRSGYYNQWNQGKRSVLLNLSHKSAPALVKRIAARCDVLVENFATGVMDKLGIGWDALRAVNPRLVFASISGYGSTGPYANYMGYGPAMGPLSGLSSATGYRGGPPCETGISIGDPVSGMSAAAAVCAALVEREQSGEGQYIDISLWEATAALAAEAWLPYAMNGEAPERRGNRDSHMAPHGLFRCVGDDNWVSIACADDAEWRALANVISPELAGDARFVSAELRKQNEDELEALLSAWAKTRDRWEITRALQAVGVAAFPSLTAADLSADLQLEQRGFLTRLVHPEVGARTHAGIPWRLHSASNGVQRVAPLIGQHTREVLGGDFEIPEAELDALQQKGVLA